MNANEFYALRKRVTELEAKIQEMIDYINRSEVKVENRLSNLESKSSYPGYKPVGMSKAEYR